MENKIDLSLRRNILDAFLVTKISWYGKLEQVNFLGCELKREATVKEILIVQSEGNRNVSS